MESYSVLEKDSCTLHNDLLQKCEGICTLPHENSLSIKEIMTYFLTRSVRIYVQKVTCFPSCFNVCFDASLMSCKASARIETN